MMGIGLLMCLGLWISNYLVQIIESFIKIWRVDSGSPRQITGWYSVGRYWNYYTLKGRCAKIIDRFSDLLLMVLIFEDL